MTRASLIFAAMVGPCVSSLGEDQSYENLSKTLFSYKLGKWLVKYCEPSETMKINSEVKLIQGRNLIQEDLEVKKLGIKGRGLSKYQAKTDTWHHMWTDNEGGYFEFIGSFAPDGEFFETSIALCCGKKISQRMNFGDIQNNFSRLTVYSHEKGCWQDTAEVRCEKLK